MDIFVEQKKIIGKNLFEEENNLYQCTISNGDETKELVLGIEFEDNIELRQGIIFKNDETKELMLGIEFEDDGKQMKQLNIKTDICNNDFIIDKKLYGNMNVTEVISKNIKLKQYIIANGNLVFQDEQGQIKEICNFNIIPKKIIIIDNGFYREDRYEMEIVLNNNIEKKKIALFKQNLVNSNWIKEKLGIKYALNEDIKSYNYLDNYISGLFENLQEEIEYTHVGWRYINGRYVFLHGGGAIGLDDSLIKGDKDKVIEIDYRLNEIQALDSVLNMINISNDNRKTLPLFLYSHLAVMREVFIQAGVEIKFSLWIYGLTGSMKTSVSKVFFNLFNRGKKEEITATFKDTITAIEIKAFEYKDCIMLIDDFHPTTSTTEKREMERLASDVLRRFGDGIGKSRSTKNLTRQKEFPPRGLCVITGEDKFGGESAVARYIGIEVIRGDFIPDRLLYFQRNPLLFSTHIFHFISWVSNNFERIKNTISEEFTDLRDRNLNLFTHQRLVEEFTIYQIISDIFLDYCINVGFISKNKKQENIKQWNDIIYDVIKIHQNSNVEQNPAIMYLMAIQQLVASNKLKLLQKGDKALSKSQNTGYFDEEKYYLFPQIAFAEVKEFWRRLSIEFPISLVQVNKALDELNIIETAFDKDGKRRRTLKISKYGDKRFLVINIEKMNQSLSGID